MVSVRVSFRGVFIFILVYFRIKTSGKKRRFDLFEIIFKLKKKRMKYTYISTN